MHPRSERGPVIDDPNSCAGNTGATHRQAVGQRQERPLGNARACGKVEDKRWAAGFEGFALVLVERKAFVAAWGRETKVFMLMFT